MSIQNIESALTKKLESLALPTAWPNATFVPVNGTPYVEPSFLPGQNESIALGTDSPVRERGIYQISIFTPSGESIKEAGDIAEQILSAFQRATNLTYGSQLVRITKSYRGPGGQTDDGWYMTPVTVEWMSDTN